MLTGIQLDDNIPFRTWATSMLPWLNAVMTDVAQGISGDIPEIKERQTRYTAYQGTLVELYSKAETYHKDALAKAIEKRSREVSASLVARVAEGDITNEIRVLNAVHRLNSTISDQLMAIASRLKFEGVGMWGQGSGKQDGKELPF